MKRPYAVWYLAIALFALAPVGFRVLAWRAPKTEPVDPVVAKAGEELFQHEWAPKDPLAATGDGLGPVFNAASCTACHNKGGVGGSGGVEDNVTNFSIRSKDGKQAREGVVHAFAVDDQKTETLADVDPSLPPLSRLKLTDLVRAQPEFEQWLRPADADGRPVCAGHRHLAAKYPCPVRRQADRRDPRPRHHHQRESRALEVGARALGR